MVSRGLCPSREFAKRLILSGRVRVNGHPAAKASDPAEESDEIALIEAERFVSRGGHKLEHALGHFQISVQGARAVDLGASTGGFTDCLLQHGASRVYAVDVGRGQLAWTLRRDPRVVVMEKTNARHLVPQNFPGNFEPVDWVTIDCSFISLRLLLAPAATLLRKGGGIVALIKPQFEAGKAEADKGRGVITDAAVHQRVIAELETHVSSLRGLHWRGVTPSPLEGPAGNKEFLCLIEKTR